MGRKLVWLACVAVAVGNEAGPSAIQGQRLRKRRLATWSEQQRHIWERCDELDRDNTGCSVSEQPQCDARQSDGPEDADIEMRLGNLPASTQEDPVHLQWWAARESVYEYDPLAGVEGCAIYHDIQQAYPKYWDSDFNGGNVIVSQSGEAVIRVRAPATYQMHCWVLYPHIHLRVCQGSRFYRNLTDTLLITNEGIVERTCSRVAPVQVLSVAHYAPPNTTTTTATSTTSSTLPAVTSTTVMQEMASETVDLRIQSARDALDLDALEFSPVYQCLVLQHFFDHFSSDCVEECPAGSEVSHGQCVRPSDLQQESFELVWRMEVGCGSGDSCWSGKKNQTLHFIRLEIADQLDIPFQDVKQVRLGYVQQPVSGRRLGVTHEALLRTRISSNRVSAAEGRGLLENAFFQGHDEVSELLGVDVHSIEVVSGEGSEQPTDSAEMGEESDPYEPAYDELDGENAWVSGTPVDFLPPVVVIGLAAVLVSAGAGTVGWFYYKRRRHAQTQEHAVIGKVVEPEDEILAAKLGISASPEPEKPQQAAAPRVASALEAAFVEAVEVSCGPEASIEKHDNPSSLLGDAAAEEVTAAGKKVVLQM